MSTRRPCVLCKRPATFGNGARWVNVPIDGVIRTQLAHTKCISDAKKQTTSQRP